MNDPDEGLIRSRETHVDLIPAPAGWRALYNPREGYDKPQYLPVVGWIKIQRTRTFVHHDSSHREEIDHFYVAAVMEEDRVVEAIRVEGLQLREVIGPPNRPLSVNHTSGSQ